jgi:hypothetical protein
MEKFIQIRSQKFPILPGEEEELVNEGMYGKALARYLQTALNDRGYEARFVCCEDWGWWLDVRVMGNLLGVCIYSDSTIDGRPPTNFVCTDGCFKRHRWNWRRFRFVDISNLIAKLHEDLLDIFYTDPEIEVVGVFDEFPEF